jgi:hypothetical protein
MEIMDSNGSLPISRFDHLVGKITGEIFSVVAGASVQDHLCLLPTLTFKVRRCLSKLLPDFSPGSEQIAQLMSELKSDAETTLRFFEYDEAHIKYLSSDLETTLLSVLPRLFPPS